MARNRTLYSLRRRYGVPVDYHHILTTVDNLETGQSTVVEEKYHLRRVIVLTLALARDMKLIPDNYPTNDIEIDTRFIIIYREDLPSDLDITTNDYITVKKKRHSEILNRYNFKTVQEDDPGIIITARYVQGR